MDQPAIRPAAHRLTVTAVRSVTPSLRRVSVAAPTLAVPGVRLAQDVGLMLDDAAGRPVRRRYTVTSVDLTAGTLDLDGVLHGDGPGAAWFAAAQPGSSVDAFGPRSGIDVVPADWYLLLADESGLPAVAELLPALAGPVHVALEVGTAAEQVPGLGGVHWVHRDGREPGAVDGFAAFLQTFTAPAGAGYAYVLGESRAVAALKPTLTALGLGADRSHVKGYWNRARPR